MFFKFEKYVNYVCSNTSQHSKQARPSSGTDVYPHMPILRPHAARTWYARRGVTNWNIHRPSRTGRFVPFWASGGAKFPEMGDSLPWTPINRRAKFDSASFILGGEIRNRTNKQTNTQTVNDISTPCLSACVDKKYRQQSNVCQK